LRTKVILVPSKGGKKGGGESVTFNSPLGKGGERPTMQLIKKEKHAVTETNTVREKGREGLNPVFPGITMIAQAEGSQYTMKCHQRKRRANVLSSGQERVPFQSCAVHFRVKRGRKRVNLGGER